MKHVLSACATVALALFCLGPVHAQGNGRQPQARCAPGDVGCHDSSRPGGRDRQIQRRPIPPPLPMHDRSRWERDDWRGDPDRYNWSGRGAHRGDRVPLDYRSKQYVVDDWQGHGLRRPPRGYHWVQNGSDYLLVAITTGLILELLLNQ